MADLKEEDDKMKKELEDKKEKEKAEQKEADLKEKEENLEREYKMKAKLRDKYAAKRRGVIEEPEETEDEEENEEIPQENETTIQTPEIPVQQPLDFEKEFKELTKEEPTKEDNNIYKKNILDDIDFSDIMPSIKKEKK